MRARLAASRTAARTFDIVVVLLLLPFVLPVAIATALAIVLDSPGGVFYRSTRVGKRGREFQMLKFRKMRSAADGAPLTLARDERFTPVGGFLATTKLDELPQLWNVLRGDMRMVGPRPELPSFVDEFADSYLEILTVTPGITGPAAVEYASESHVLSLQGDPMAYYRERIMPRKLAIDSAYVRNRTMRLDIAIIARTLLVPFRRLAANARRNRARQLHAVVLVGVGISLLALFAATAAGV